ncbi:MAG: hypothetical protein JRL30_29695 [Deltaproteobacteria bacterium]|nr:hypothetical protein [Deltaproteobacteria bacterium]
MCLRDKLEEISHNWLKLDDTEKFLQYIELSRLAYSKEKEGTLTAKSFEGILIEHLSEQICNDMLRITKQRA